MQLSTQNQVYCKELEKGIHLKFLLFLKYILTLFKAKNKTFFLSLFFLFKLIIYCNGIGNVLKWLINYLKINCFFQTIGSNFFLCFLLMDCIIKSTDQCCWQTQIILFVQFYVGSFVTVLWLFQFNLNKKKLRKTQLEDFVLSWKMYNCV